MASPAPTVHLPLPRATFDNIDVTGRTPVMTQAEVRAQRCATFLRQRNPNDVRFYFLRNDGVELEQWPNVELLSEASPYFKTLFESEFAEATVTSSSKKRKVVASPHQTAQEQETTLNFEDSDEEGDSITAESFVARDSPSSSPFREVKVTQTAYTTYDAVLTYLLTSYITFAPLRRGHDPVSARNREIFLHYRGKDAPPPCTATPHPTQQFYLRAELAIKPHLPLPSSPKSVYRLAHLLGLPDLQRISVDRIANSLMPWFIAWEVFGSLSGCFEDVRYAELSLTRRWWPTVKLTPAYKAVREAEERGEMPYCAMVTRELVDLLD